MGQEEKQEEQEEKEEQRKEEEEAAHYTCLNSDWYVWCVFMAVCSSWRTLRTSSWILKPISRHFL